MAVTGSKMLRMGSSKEIYRDGHVTVLPGQVGHSGQVLLEYIVGVPAEPEPSIE